MSDDPITKMLPERILDVLQDKRAKIQFEELKNSLPEFSDLPDSDWYATIEDLSSDGVIQASLVRTGIDGTVRAAYNIGITKRGRTLAPENRVQNDSAAKASESDDRQFANLAVAEARKSVPEDERVHPRVGVVVVRDGRVLAMAHRGEILECHAEYIALEKKLSDVTLAGATVYTTLEPCTSRNHPKVPCADRLAERKVARVVIDMLDPDDRISGRGQRALRRAGTATTLFDDDLMTEIEELNRDFIREREAAASAAPPAAPEALCENNLEEVVIGFLKKAHPNTGYDYEEVSTDTNLTKRDARDTLERLERQGRVWSTKLMEAKGGKAYFLDDVER